MSDYHCTMYFDPSCSKVFEDKWNHETKDLHVNVTSQNIIIGVQGAAASVETNPFITKWYKVPHSAPHITLMVNEGFESKDLGPMMLTASQIEWKATDNPLVFTTDDASMIKIICGSFMTAKPQIITAPRKTEKQSFSATEKYCDELKQEILKEIPEELWSKHDTDVGLIKSANPVQIELKPNVKLPYRPQYPMKPEAEIGISKTINGLLEAGILKETRSSCNTPILPVLKTDKSTYRLVHDLRAINEIISDSTAEVPNPNTLLTNIPPDAKYFTVIDLCSAFFSIPLAEESQYLFAFKYRDKQYCYTRMPQGF
ncbi:uncharacterized protein LOC106530969, partial [Austrofundulus limnaeus]|uniref:ribonuclease H n=1 Tax=Austrofundulus limnaeus TaxID=52670 RepID=A0A2I4CQ85_AUSLI